MSIKSSLKTIADRARRRLVDLYGVSMYEKTLTLDEIIEEFKYNDEYTKFLDRTITCWRGSTNWLDMVGKYAFYACEQLTYVQLVQMTTRIEAYAFGNCTSLSEIVFDREQLKYIENGAFLNCISLAEIRLPATMKTISSTAFTGCTNLTTIKCCFPKGQVSGAPWGAPNESLQIIYNYTGE